MIGSSNDDRIAGDNGPNRINGSGGMDYVNGLGAHDVLTGGQGVDFFEFTQSDGVFRAEDSDTILDFGDNDLEAITLDLSNVQSGSYIEPFLFINGKEATTPAQRAIYDQAEGKFYYDEDGNGPISKVLIAILSGRPPVTAEDVIFE